MTDTTHTIQLTEAEMRAYESGRKAGFAEVRKAMEKPIGIPDELRAKYAYLAVRALIDTP